MTFDADRFAPRTTGPTALFLDTSGLFPYFHPGTDEHDAVAQFMRAIAANDLPYRPLFTNTYVVDELVTLLQSKGRHQWARDAYETITDSETVTLLTETEAAFEAAGDHLSTHTGDISFTDRFSAVQMREQSVDHVLAFDCDYDRLGFTVLPHSSE